MRFEWSSDKAAKNLRKHRVSFEEASTVFYDQLAATGADPDQSRSAFPHPAASLSWLTLSAAMRFASLQHRAKGTSMKKAKSRPDDLRPEYKRSDFAKMERGRYYQRMKAASNIVVIDPDVSAIFPNSAAVNKALHSLVDVAQKASGLTTRSSGRARKRHAA